MANSHWSQFSYKPKFFFISAIPFVLTLPLIMLSQISKWFLLILVVIWVYTIIFEVFFKMPLEYTTALFRVWITGRSKRAENLSNKLDL